MAFDGTGDTFAQLIAVRLIADIGGPDAAPPLERALEPTVWMPTRMAALYGISKQSPEVGRSDTAADDTGC